MNFKTWNVKQLACKRDVLWPFLMTAVQQNIVHRIQRWIETCFKTNAVIFKTISSVFFQKIQNESWSLQWNKSSSDVCNVSASIVSLSLRVMCEGNNQDWNPLSLCRSTNGIIDSSLQNCTFAVLWYVTMYKNIIVLRAKHIGSLGRMKLELCVSVLETLRIWGSDEKVLWGLRPTIAAAGLPAQTWEAPLWHEGFTWSWFQRLEGG